jgi:hypothetical protein
MLGTLNLSSRKFCRKKDFRGLRVQIRRNFCLDSQQAQIFIEKRDLDVRLNFCPNHRYQYLGLSQRL